MQSSIVELAAVGLALAGGLTPVVGAAARRLGWVDRPGLRKIHPEPTPHGGGLAVFAAIAAGLVGVDGTDPRVRVILMGGAVATLLGLADDRLDLPSRYRLAAQFLIAVTLASLGVRAAITGVALVDIVLAALWLVGAMNAWNCLDCADGAAAGSGAIGCLALGVLAAHFGRDYVAATAFLSAGACAGFALYNLPPARLFLGDTGSTLIGLLLGSLSLLAVPVEVQAGAIPWGCLVLAVPVFDFVLVHWRRYQAGVRSLRGLLASAGKDHLPHRLLVHGLTPWGMLLVLYLLVALPAAAALALGSGRLVECLMSLAATAALLWHLDENCRIEQIADNVFQFTTESSSGIAAAASPSPREETSG